MDILNLPNQKHIKVYKIKISEGDMKTISRLLSLIGMTFVLATTNPIYAGGNCQECDLLKDWKDFYSEILLDIQKRAL